MSITSMRSRTQDVRTWAASRSIGTGTFRTGLLSLVMAGAAVALVRPCVAASKDVDLNADGTVESTVALTVVTSSPVKVQDKITNRAVGAAFTFRWPSAGPGGFSSSLPAGTTSGVGSIWTWQTTQQMYSYTGNTCTNDICFTRTSNSTSRGPFGVPGRSLSSSGVTVSSSSLTSSLITFFSPPVELFRITSLVDQVAPGLYRYKTRIDNFTSQPITVNQSSGPLGCDSVCGNDVREGSEVCDGSDLNGQSCGSFGQQGSLFCASDCTSFDTKGCYPFPCGNNVREGYEVCDGTDLGGYSCGDLGGTGGALGCQFDCSAYDVGDCEGLCGNGTREGSESCDGSDLGGQDCGSLGGDGGSLSCSSSCTYDISGCQYICGNGVREGKEGCDGQDFGEGSSCSGHGGGGTLSCNATCQVDYSGCTSTYCGNNVIDTPYEQCDGSDLGGQSCTTQGGTGGSLSCDGGCSYDYSGCTGYCGNGVKEGSEQCDMSDFGGFTCEDFGGSGALKCSGECGFDTAGCFPAGSIPCDHPPSTDTVDGLSSHETCDFDSHPAKEVSSKVKVCGAAIPGGDITCDNSSDPATEGTANILVPDTSVYTGGVFFSSPGVTVIDADGDGLPQPGEVVQLLIPLRNIGYSRATGVSAELVSPPRDLDGDGIQDTVTITVASSSYPDGPCFDGFPHNTIDCDDPPPTAPACTNLVPFVVAFPANHPIDVSRKFELHITYTLGAQEALETVSMPLVLGVGSSECGNGVREAGEECDDENTVDGDCCSSTCHLDPVGSVCTSDGNLCTTDACDAIGVCRHTPSTAGCDDGNPCTNGDTCSSGTCTGTNAPAGQACTSDGNVCTTDACNGSGTCAHANNTITCDDGNACTTGDVCSGGTCHGGGALNCNDGNVCTNDSCNPATGCINACNNSCNTKGQGYWKRLCHGPHSGDFYTQRDVDCVNDSCTFADVHTIPQMCDKLDQHGHAPNDQGGKCAKAEEKFMSLLLNRCRCRVQGSQTVNSHCGTHTTVDQAIATSDANLCSPNRTRQDCEHAECASTEIDNGEALWANSLRITRVGQSVKLTWSPPYAEPDEANATYRIWRRVPVAPGQSPIAFTQIGTVRGSNLTYTDTNAATRNYEYEITVD